uniref:Protein RIC1 homolog n=1 Tax=Parastrongyloides trichosuri TaxID=131310 RepID=A0A0N4ZHJ0_PARTI
MIIPEGATIQIELPKSTDDSISPILPVYSIIGNRDRSLIAVCTSDTLCIYLAKPQILLASYRRNSEEVIEKGEYKRLYWKYDSKALFVSTSKAFAYIYQVETSDEHCLDLYDSGSNDFQRKSKELYMKFPNISITLKHTVMAKLQGIIMALVPLKEEIFLALNDGWIHRLSWDGYFLDDMSFQVSNIPINMDQINPKTSKNLPRHCYIVDMIYCPLIGGIATVFSNGRAGLLISSDPIFEKDNIFAIFAGRSSDYLTVSTNHKYRLIYFGKKNGGIAAYHIDESNGSLSQSFKVELKLCDSTELLSYVGACISIQCLPQGNSFAALFKSHKNTIPIIAIFSPFGAQWWCSLENDALRNEKFLCGHLTSFDFGTEGFSLWVGTAESNHLTIIPLAKNIMINHPAMESVNNIIMLSDRHVHCSPSRERERYSRASYAIWNSIEIPFDYISLNWPIRYVACDEYCEKHLAVAGTRGFAIYNLIKKRWKLFRNEQQENNLSVTGGMFIWNDYLITVSCDIEKNQEEIIFYNLTVGLDAASAFRYSIPNRVTMINFRRGYLMTLDVQSIVTIYFISILSDKNTSDEIFVEHCAEIRIAELLPHPTCVVSIHLAMNSGYSQTPTFCPGLDTILINNSGNLLVISPQKKEIVQNHPGSSFDNSKVFQLPQPILIASSVEHVWMNNCKENIPQLNKALWINCGSKHMKVWLPLLHSSLSPKSSLLDERAFLSRRIMLSLNTNIYPLIISSDYLTSGIKSVCSVIKEGIIKKNEDVTVVFSSTRDNEVFIHQLLKQLLKRNLGIYSLEIANHCKNLPYFQHTLELLLHNVLEEEATSSEPTPDPLMPRVVAFIREFPEYLQTVVHCARKTELALWSYLFNACGHPKDLFRRCLEEELLDIAASYLIILQSTESNYASVQQASVLFEEALIKRKWEIARDIIRFLKSIDPSDMCDMFSGVNVSQKLSQQRGKSTICNVQQYPEDSFDFMFTEAHLVVKRKDTNKCEPSSPISESGRHDSIVSNDDERNPLMTSHSNSITAVSIPKYLNYILKQHANYLLEDYSLRDLAAFSTHLKFNLVSFFRDHAKNERKTIRNFSLALLKLHSQFHWPFPVQEEAIVDSLSTKFGNNVIFKQNNSESDTNDTKSNISVTSSEDATSQIFVDVDFFQKNKGSTKSKNEVVWILNKIIAAGSYEWIFLFSVFSKNFDLFKKSLKIAKKESLITVQTIIHIQDGYEHLVKWSKANCIGYTNFLETISDKVKEINDVLGPQNNCRN